MSVARAKGKGGLYLAIVASLVVVATLFAAIRVMGTPGQQRLARLDARRIDDLQGLVRAVRHHARTLGAMPASVQAAAAGSDMPVNDRVTGVPYGYAIKGKSVFQVCAVFDTSTSEVLPADRSPFPVSRVEWHHPAGRHCFDVPLEEED